MVVNEILKEQKRIGEEIKAAATKFNNTQLESRNLNFAQERAKKLNSAWNLFLYNHRKLQESNELDGGHSYFGEDHYSTIKQIRDAYDKELQTLLNYYGTKQQQKENDYSFPSKEATKNPDPLSLDSIFKGTPSNPENVDTLGGATGGETSTASAAGGETFAGVIPKRSNYAQTQPIGQSLNIDNLFRKFSASQNNLHELSGAHSEASINKYHNFQEELRFFSGLLNEYNNKDPETSESDIMRVQELIARKWGIIDKMHQRFLIEYPDYEATPYRRLEADVDHILFSYKQRQQTQHGSPSGPNNYQSSRDLSAKLPKLQVPKFSNDCIAYQSFKELFMTMIGSRSGLNDVEKFAYLKGQLEGESLRLITNLPIQNSSYQTAWNILDSRFDNQQKIISKLFETIVDIKPMKNNHSSELKEMVDAISQVITALENIGMPVDTLSNSFLYFHTERKIHPSIVRLYENTLTIPGSPRTYEEFMKFLQCRVQNSSSSKNPESSGIKQKLVHQFNNHNGNKNARTSTSLVSAGSPAKKKNNCCCKEKHPLFICPKFLEMVPQARLKKCQELKRCVNCLRTGHGAKTCTVRACSKCNKKHNTLLHLENAKAVEKTSLLGSAVANEEFNHVFLATAIIELTDKYGNPVRARALLDSGSQINMITEKLHQKLSIPYKSTKMKISGVGTASIMSHKRSVINLNSLHSGFKAPLEVYVVKNVTTCQPLHEVNITEWKIPKNIALADPQFNMPATVDIIIGGEIFFNLISIGLISIGKNLPDLQNSVFGWVVIGKLLGLERNEVFAGISTQQSLDKQVAAFWKMEEKYQTASRFTNLEQECEKFFEETTKRNPQNGKFIVRLQFLKEPSILGNSEIMAMRRFQYLEKRFLREPSMKTDYVQFMREYENLGHMMPIDRKEIGNKYYIIPHHAVRNPSSSTTKFRVVFDASAKTTTNISLNETLANGPILQDDLFSIMVRFRKHRYVFSADITKMYRQVEVDPDDMKWQIILWREEPHLPVKLYKLKTLTYGTTCASYLAIKSLQSLAEEWKTTLPNGSTAAKRDFNVDDVMTGSDDLYQAILIQQQLIELCGKANFQLHKWCSNHPALLDSIPKKKQEVSLEFNAEKTETKALGMKWIPKNDRFMLHYNPKEYKKITKRTVLSETAQLFDPLGLVNPVIVLAKIFLQELWSLKLDWDASLPMALHFKWEEFRKELLKLNDVAIPRHMIIKNPVDLQLHAFSDASTRAYGTAFYLRSVSAEGTIQVNLICSKSRVAPVIATTLPRLELCAGMVMVELAEKLNKVLDINLSSITYWTDSELVLSWIYNDGTYKTFVANRIAAIRKQTNKNDWKYINTKLNPADLLSRGVLPEKLINSELWWHGPKFLQLDQEHWPQVKPNFIQAPEEERLIKTVLAAIKTEEDVINRINHHNSIRTLQRVVAYMMRFKVRKSSIQDSNQSNEFGKEFDIVLTKEELQKALTKIIKYCQQQAFSTEIDLVKKGKGERTKFSNFVPIIDAEGILRVGGRLHSASIPFEQQHPALLPKDHFVTRLIMQRIHLENMHAGPQALLAITRQKYWPENGKLLSQSIVKQCVLCVRSKPKLMEQIMGTLPFDRVNQARPFIHVGLDFGGPITIHYKLRGKRPTKAYICLFVCYTTKAVHIEAATDLTTEAFINCLKRFIARRSLPKKIFCDNATNFTAASTQLGELKTLMMDRSHQETVTRYCSDHHIEWKFIPPRSPHFAGLQESAIKSCKLHMKKVLHAVQVTYDELITVLAEIEAILNSRPLTPMSNDPSDLQPLTAGHFLVGAPLHCIDDREIIPTSKNQMWTKMRMLKQEFWKRWSKEYLAELQQRSKWLKNYENIRIGDMVLLKESNRPPLNWKIARITDTISDSFGKIRVVMVKTHSGSGFNTIILRRAIHEVALLPRNQDKTKEVVEPIPVSSPEQAIMSNTIEQNELQPKKKLNPAASTFEPVITRSKTKKSINSANMMFLACIGLMTWILGAVGQSCNISTFKTNPGLYFEEQGQLSLTHDSWNIICYVQLSDYWNQSITIRSLIDRLDEICQQLKSTEYCNITRNQLRTQLSLILSKNELIRGFSHTRKRRAWSVEKTYFNGFEKLENINHDSFSFHEPPTKLLTRQKRAWMNFIGNGLKLVTGVLNEDDANQFNEKIDNINQDVRHVLQLIGNQTTIQEITQNIIKRDEVGIYTQLRRMENEIEILRNNTAAEKAELFNALAIQAVSLINYHFITQNDIIETITKIHHGKISANIITPKQLKQHILVMANNIPKELMVPGDDHAQNIAKIYSILTAQTRVTTSRIIFKLTLPLLHREFLKLFHIIPVPFSYRNSTLKIIELEQQYIGVNSKQDHYYLLSHQQRTDCKLYSEDLLICPQNSPLHSIHTGEVLCPMAIFTHQSKGIPPKCNTREISGNQFWSKLHSTNHFLFTMKTSTTINVICKEVSSACMLKESGIINLPSQCMIQSGDLEIVSHNTYNNAIPIVLVPGINISDVLNENTKKSQLTLHDHQHTYEPDADMQLLESAIQTQKLNQNYSPLSTFVNWHDIHHYSMTYILLTIIILFIGWHFYKEQRIRCLNPTTNSSVQAEEFEIVVPTSSYPQPKVRHGVRVVAPQRTNEEVSFK